MIRIVGIVIVLLAGGVLAFAASRPDNLRVERSATIQAPPERIYPLITDFRRWSGWSPYEHRDPAMKRTYSGAAAGTGAVYAWQGNSQAGEGRMEITGTTVPSHVAIKLDFIKPFEGHNTATFNLVPQGESTRVTWAMEGPTPFLGKLMGVFIDMEAMLGSDFETGLQNLRALAERAE